MSMLKDSSELHEASRLFWDLFDENQAADHSDTGVGLGDRTPEQPPGMAGPDPSSVEPEAIAGFRDDRLESELVGMCQRGRFSGAVVADTLGLPLAVHNSPVKTESIAVFTSILGDALAKAGRFLGQTGAENIAMNINDKDKVVVRRFSAAGLDLFLMVLCAQSIDERRELEVTIARIVAILG